MENRDMTKEEREEAILRFMAKYGLALPLTPIFENLRRKEGITFSKRTVKRRLEDLEEAGYVQWLDIGRGYWEITQEGKERVKNID